MKQKLLCFCMLGMLLIGSAYAQDRRISGKVTSSEDGMGIVGVSVQAVGANVGTQTDEQGNYVLTVPESATALRFVYLGYTGETVNIGSSDIINAVLSLEEQALDEVVVTALGIQRERKALGYATQQVVGEELTSNTNQNFLNNISGRVAGAQITAASGAVGASSRIVLRGNNSFGNNQPLFVIDGVPIDNGYTSIGAGGSTDYGSGIQDLDPNNIESMNVLKGANAAALYGSRAANGVIVITTKSGAKTKGIGVSYNGGVSFEKPYIMPSYQNLYGQGFGGSEYDYNNAPDKDDYANYNEWAIANSFHYVDGNGAGMNDDADESWGPRLDIGLMIPQFNSPRDESGNLIPTPWISHPDNVSGFFKTGYTVDNNVAVTSNTERNTSRFSYTNQHQIGSIPNTDQTRNTIQLNTTQRVTEKLKIDALMNYVRTKNDNLSGAGYNSYNPLNSLGSWFGRQVDLEDLERNRGAVFPDDGRPYNWISIYHDNPYTMIYDIFNQKRTKDRLFGYASVSYEFDEWFNAMLRVGNDWSYENRWETTSDSQIDMYRAGAGGNFRQREYYRNETNVDFMLTGQGDFSDVFSLSYIAGANYRNSRIDNSMIFAEDLLVPGVYNIGNVNGYPQATNNISHLRSNSLFAQASLGYKGWLFLDATARNDWSSTLPEGNWSYFYPSVSLSWIFTEALGIGDSFLNFGKLRGSWAQVGNATDPYQTLATYLAVTPAFGGVPQYRVDPQLPPLNLKPESVASTEIGLELAAFNSRLRLDATYYDKTTSNQIMAVDLARFSGASTLLINAGEIQNKGVEVQLGGSILRRDNGLNWDIDVNWAVNKNQVNALYTDPNTGQELERYRITGAWATNVVAEPGKPYGVINGKAYRRYVDDSGVRHDNTIVVNANGLPLFDDQLEIGNITPDWVGGVNNTFRYRDLSLSFLVDFRKGGDIFSVTQMFGATTGVMGFTAENGIRENGLVVGRDILTDFNVVKADGSPNDQVITAEDFFAGVSYSSGGTEFDIIDGSFIKLRNINLTYQLPTNLVSNWGWVQGASISLFANNVALLYTHKSNISNIDPETGFGVGNSGLGVEQYQIPSNRSVGLKLNVSF